MEVRINCKNRLAEIIGSHLVLSFKHAIVGMHAIATVDLGFAIEQDVVEYRLAHIVHDE